MSTLVSSSISIAVPGLKEWVVFLRGIALSCQIYLRICAGAIIQEYHRSVKGCERILSGADAMCMDALVTLKEVLHTVVFHLVPLRLMPCSNL